MIDLVNKIFIVNKHNISEDKMFILFNNKLKFYLKTNLRISTGQANGSERQKFSSILRRAL